MIEQGRTDEEYARSLMEAELVKATPARNMVGLTEDEEFARNLDAEGSLQEKQDAELARMMQQVHIAPLLIPSCEGSSIWPIIINPLFNVTGRSFLIIQ
jgi:hypothetical protein